MHWVACVQLKDEHCIMSLREKIPCTTCSILSYLVVLSSLIVLQSFYSQLAYLLIFLVFVSLVIRILVFSEVRSFPLGCDHNNRDLVLQ